MNTSWADMPFNKQDLPMKNRAGYIKREIKNKISHRRNSSKIQWKHRYWFYYE
jgi:hypothetical protein